MNTAEILRAAAARVMRGWCQNDYQNNSGGVCAIGAICTVLGVVDLSMHTFNPDVRRVEDGTIIKYLVDALRLQAKPGMAQVPQWNDAKGQTAENVAAGLEYAAMCWEQEQQHTAAPSAAESLVPCNRS